jgi:hypothetical protein
LCQYPAPFQPDLRVGLNKETMLVAKSNSVQQAVLGTELNPETCPRDQQLIKNISCLICSSPVTYSQSRSNDIFSYFSHADGSSDCFATEGTSKEHRLAVEVTAKELYNHIQQVVGLPVEIDVEKWVGDRPSFVITDIRISRPIKIAVEVYYRINALGLRRRLDTIFDNDFRAYLIFHSTGRHSVDRVERHIHKATSLQVGRFERATFDVSLGDLFTKKRIDLSNLNENRLPKYIVR